MTIRFTHSAESGILPLPLPQINRNGETAQ
jgi:hypothetical protein